MDMASERVSIEEVQPLLWHSEPPLAHSSRFSSLRFSKLLTISWRWERRREVMKVLICITAHLLWCNCPLHSSWCKPSRDAFLSHSFSHSVCFDRGVIEVKQKTFRLKQLHKV